MSFVREWWSLQKKVSSFVMWYLEHWNYFLTPIKKILNTILVLALRAMSADLNTNFGFVCELKALIKSCTKVGLHQNTAGEDI